MDPTTINPYPTHDDWQLVEHAQREALKAAAYRAEWLAERRKGVGSSDISNIFGIGFKTALAVYLEKTDQLPDMDPPELQRGLLLEEGIAQMYALHTQRPVIPPRRRLVWSDEHPWLYASLDRRTIVDGRLRVLEIKTATNTKEWGDPGTDEIPDAYNLQTQEQMLVTKIETADVAVFFSTHDFRIYTVEFSPALARIIVEKSKAFWDRVQNREPPELDLDHRTTPSLLAALYGAGKHREIELGQEAAELAKQLVYWKDVQSACDKKAKGFDNRLRALMEDATKATLPGGITLTRKTVNRKGFTVAPTSYVQFKVHGVQHATDTGNEPGDPG